MHGLKPVSTDPIWIGAIRQGTGFVWVDGARLNYTNWKSGEPNDFQGSEDCVTMGKKGSSIASLGAQWNDVSCRLTADVVCKQSIETGQFG